MKREKVIILLFVEMSYRR